MNEEEQINTCLKAAAEDGSREGQEGQGNGSEGRCIGIFAVSESQKLYLQRGAASQSPRFPKLCSKHHNSFKTRSSMNFERRRPG